MISLWIFLTITIALTVGNVIADNMPQHVHRQKLFHPEENDTHFRYPSLLTFDMHSIE